MPKLSRCPLNLQHPLVSHLLSCGYQAVGEQYGQKSISTVCLIKASSTSLKLPLHAVPIPTKALLALQEILSTDAAASTNAKMMHHLSTRLQSTPEPIGRGLPIMRPPQQTNLLLLSACDHNAATLHRYKTNRKGDIYFMINSRSAHESQLQLMPPLKQASLFRSCAIQVSSSQTSAGAFFAFITHVHLTCNFATIFFSDAISRSENTVDINKGQLDRVGTSKKTLAARAAALGMTAWTAGKIPFHSPSTHPLTLFLSCQCNFISRVGVVLPPSPVSRSHVRNGCLGFHADASRARPWRHPTTLQLVELVFLL
jgi:hypothetical protein